MKDEEIREKLLQDSAANDCQTAQSISSLHTRIEQEEARLRRLGRVNRVLWMAGLSLFLASVIGLVFFIVWDAVNLRAWDSQLLVIGCLLPSAIILSIAGVQSVRLRLESRYVPLLEIQAELRSLSAQVESLKPKSP